MNHYKYLLFDLDGTLSESAPGIIKAVQYGLDAVGIHERDMKKLSTFIGPPLNVQMKKLYHMSDADIVTAVTKFRELYETEGIFDCRPYDGLDRLLPQAVETGYILAVASSKPEPFVKEIIGHFGFAPFFSTICGSDIGDELKKRAVASQKARIIRKAMGDLEERGYAHDDLWQNTVMIGDTAYDIEGAKENHLPSIGCTYGYGSREELTTAGADRIVSSVKELMTVLLP
ncbi:HAD hydrolase-like protein [uncultured Dialister sp.]|jgi:phosphoglycolate phosphatase|uniref:HAD hydrolase-like protein n=1 Tax=uncultured Dialister sp. TaxID=278064 RepID=UPI0025DC0D88|nr:HAD hydrolase-like protein [uncultured Dialister sp.]